MGQGVNQKFILGFMAKRGEEDRMTRGNRLELET